MTETATGDYVGLDTTAHIFVTERIESCEGPLTIAKHYSLTEDVVISTARADSPGGELTFTDNPRLTSVARRAAALWNEVQETRMQLRRLITDVRDSLVALLDEPLVLVTGADLRYADEVPLPSGAHACAIKAVRFMAGEAPDELAIGLSLVLSNDPHARVRAPLRIALANMLGVFRPVS